jgi:hypothetical protein
MVTTEPSNESLPEILARLEARYITPFRTLPAPGQADSRAPRQHVPTLPETTTTPWAAETMVIPAEVFLETLGFFTPSSKRLRGIYTKEKRVGERVVADGTTRMIKTKISANHELGLPITADLDYYRAFLKILAIITGEELVLAHFP